MTTTIKKKKLKK